MHMLPLRRRDSRRHRDGTRGRSPGVHPVHGPRASAAHWCPEDAGAEPIYVTFDGRHLTRAEAVAEVGEAEVQHRAPYWVRHCGWGTGNDRIVGTDGKYVTGIATGKRCCDATSGNAAQRFDRDPRVAILPLAQWMHESGADPCCGCSRWRRSVCSHISWNMQR